MCSKNIKGMCMQMCPKSEMLMRQKEGLLHILEIDKKAVKYQKPRADPNRIVKCFSRSAAGQIMTKPEDLRPAPVLKKTVQYLLKNVVLTANVQWDIIYNFIMDRLRAVRQDMLIQSVPAFDSIQILEPIVRFYCYSAYRLCRESLNKFDPVINKVQLLECLKRILVFYDELENNNDISDDSYKSRPEMESLYLLLNIGDTIALRRVLGLSKTWKKNSLIHYSYLISLAWYHTNYVRVCKMIQSLPPLLHAVTVLNLPVIRRKTLEIMSISYNSKVLSYPLDKLTVLLLYNDEKELYDDLCLCGLKADGTTVYFNKNTYNANGANLSPLQSSVLDNRLSQNKLPDLLLFPNNNLYL